MSQVPCTNPAHGVQNHIAGSVAARECAVSRAKSNTSSIPISMVSASSEIPSDVTAIMQYLGIDDPNLLEQVDTGSRPSVYVLHKPSKTALAHAYTYIPNTSTHGSSRVESFDLQVDDPTLDVAVASDIDILKRISLDHSATDGVSEEWVREYEIEDMAAITRSLVTSYRLRSE